MAKAIRTVKVELNQEEIFQIVNHFNELYPDEMSEKLREMTREECLHDTTLEAFISDDQEIYFEGEMGKWED